MMRIRHVTFVSFSLTLLLLTACGSINRMIGQIHQGEGYPHADALKRSLTTSPPRVQLKHYKSVQDKHSRPWQRPDIAVAVAASGGGYRASNLTAGVLLGLERLQPPGIKANLLQEVDYFSSVSGGGFAIGLYLSRLYHYQLHSKSMKPYSWNREFFDRLHPLSENLRIDHSEDLTFGYKRTLRLESSLNKELLQVDPDRSLRLGDIFIPVNAPKQKKPTLPIWITNSTIIQNNELLQFTPDVITQYDVTHYIHDYMVYPINYQDKKIYGYDIPVAVAMTASATYPYAVAGTTLWTNGCKEQCYLHLFDGGLEDNLGLYTAIDLLRQDNAKIQVLIIIDAYSENQEPYSKSKFPPRHINLFTEVMSSVSGAFQRNMQTYAPMVARDILCAEGAKQVLVAYLNLSKHPSSARIPTSLWMTKEDQKKLITTGLSLVRHNSVLTKDLPALLQGAHIGTCTKRT